MNRYLTLFVGMAAAASWLFPGMPLAAADPLEIAVIRPEVQTGFVNGGFNLDRYKDLPPLDAHKTITVADLKGPGIIRHIHLTRHSSKELSARGVVLEIWFDGDTEPAVRSPLADFFGDGCNGQAMDFSTPLIECAPSSYNSYIPMPFKSRAQVRLRNDTDKNLVNYTYVEWEKLPEWRGELGYFHATYERKCFQLAMSSDVTFFEVKGTGHLLGRQFSIVTDEPLFHRLEIVQEGNNEVDIDGQPRAIDYLGSEDSFTFSWGFLRTFAGQHAGITLAERDKTPARVSVFRFHDHQPIRFEKSLRWHIDWTQERHIGNWGGKWPAVVAKGGSWVDYATVFYWYQTVPGGYQHAPLPPVAERAKTMLHPNLTSPAQ